MRSNTRKRRKAEQDRIQKGIRKRKFIIHSLLIALVIWCYIYTGLNFEAIDKPLWWEVIPLFVSIGSLCLLCCILFFAGMYSIILGIEILYYSIIRWESPKEVNYSFKYFENKLHF